MNEKKQQKNVKQILNLMDDFYYKTVNIKLY